MNIEKLMTDDASEQSSHASGGDTEPVEGAEVSEDGAMVATERKRVSSTALSLFVIIVIGAAGTYFMHLRTGPQSAAAGTDLTAAVTVTNFLADGRRTLNQMRVLLLGTQKLVEQFKIYPSVAQVPLTELKANPFHLNSAQAAVVEDAAEVARKKKEAEKLAALQGAQGLQIQSVMRSGSKHLAMINNTMCQEGDTIGGFMIEKIAAATVIVKQGAYRFELRMQK